MNKNKKTIIVVGVLLCVCIIGIITYFATRPIVDDGGDVVTESDGMIYEDTTDINHTAYIYSFAYTDVATSGDNVVVTKKSKGFKFDCHGLTPNQKLYVFVDGNIDHVAGEFNVNTNNKVSYSNKIKLDESFLSKGEHIVQFVQFDGPDVIFCKTRHYKVEE